MIKTVKVKDINNKGVILSLTPAEALNILCETLDIDLMGYSQGKVVTHKNIDGKESVYHYTPDLRCDMYDERLKLYDAIERLCECILEDFDTYKAIYEEGVTS